MSDRAWLVPVAGGPALELAAELCLVGRQADCDVQLDDKTVSKIHCALARAGGTLLLRDLGSTNGCRINGEKAQRGTLRANDLLTVAGFDFRLHFGAAPAVRPQYALDRTECLPAAELGISDSGLAAMTEPARGVVFDMDGVIFDTERLYWAAEGEMLARRGMRFTEDLAAKIMGLPGEPAMALLAATLGLPDAPAALYAEAQELFQAKLPDQLRFMPGFPQLLDAVERAGLPRAVATSTARPLAERMLRQMGVRERFQQVLTRDDVTHGKPAPDIFLAACARLGLSPDHCVALEDSGNGVAAALAAGCQTFALRHDCNRMLVYPAAAVEIAAFDDPRLCAALGLVP